MSWKHITTLSDPGSSNGYSFLSYYYKSFITVSEKGNLHESEKKKKVQIEVYTEVMVQWFYGYFIGYLLEITWLSTRFRH